MQVEDDPTGGKFASASGLLNGAANKLEDVINFHVGDSITALQRSALQPGGQEVLVYSTLLGSLGSLLPFVSREDWDFFSHLEMHMRQELAAAVWARAPGIQRLLLPHQGCHRRRPLRTVLFG